MRSTEESTDTFGKLGPKVEQPSKPAETWKPTDNPVIQQNRDGKLRTNQPLPKIPVITLHQPSLPEGTRFDELMEFLDLLANDPDRSPTL